MKTLKFRTNINCSGCVKAVSPTLDNEKEMLEWGVDTLSPDKVLSVKTESMTQESVIALIKKAGFNAEVYK